MIVKNIETNVDQVRGATFFFGVQSQLRPYTQLYEITYKRGFFYPMELYLGLDII
jgi:hypothetical protein